MRFDYICLFILHAAASCLPLKTTVVAISARARGSHYCSNSTRDVHLRARLLSEVEQGPVDKRCRLYAPRFLECTTMGTCVYLVVALRFSRHNRTFCTAVTFYCLSASATLPCVTDRNYIYEKKKERKKGNFLIFNYATAPQNEANRTTAQ